MRKTDWSEKDAVVHTPLSHGSNPYTPPIVTETGVDSEDSPRRRMTRAFWVGAISTQFSRVVVMFAYGFICGLPMPLRYPEPLRGVPGITAAAVGMWIECLLIFPLVLVTTLGGCLGMLINLFESSRGQRLWMKCALVACITQLIFLITS